MRISRILHLTSAIVSMALLYGCATAKSSPSVEYHPQATAKMELNITNPADVTIPSDQYTYLVGKLKKELQERGLLASDKSQPQLKVNIDVKSYRMRNDAARLSVGILAGCDNIDSEVTVTRSDTSDVLGKTEVKIKECAAWGVATQVIDKYVEGVVVFLTNEK